MARDAPLQTPLQAWHAAHGARMVEFGGWLMPVQYTSIVEEHHAVRRGVGLFDISHMGRLRFDGPDAEGWLDALSTNHVARLNPYQIQYSLMVDAQGGVLDDILVYRLDRGFLVVCNASNRAKVVEQFQRHQEGRQAVLHDETFATGMIAVQGPAARGVLERVCTSALESVGYYHATRIQLLGHEILASRTGYTGEDGFEIIVPRALAEPAWSALMEAGHDASIRPCGLGARDTLRFEAAMPLYGHELTEQINPYEAGVGWAVKLKKGAFLGRDALQALKAHPARTRIGLALSGKRIARQGCGVKQRNRVVGTVTSGTFSPTLERSLAMALVDRTAAEPGMRLDVDVRGHDEPADVVPLPFYRRPSANGH